MAGALLKAELHRLRGEAEASLQKGIDVARRQNAKFWELRGAMSLARRRQQQGRQQEAVTLLAPILAWFEEGFDTADLQAARTLLDELAGGAGAAADLERATILLG
jgi:predicted ATPase